MPTSTTKSGPAPSIPRRAAVHLRQTFLAGVLLMGPVAITYLLLRFLFDNIDNFLRPAFRGPIADYAVPGFGVAVLVVLVYFAGLVGRNFIGRRIVRAGQATLLRIPLINTFYSPAKQLIESFSGVGLVGFRRVVMIEYPRKGTWTIGFLTGVTRDEAGTELAVVYIPTAPTPNSGWVAILPMSDVCDLNMSVPEAMKLVVSGGIMTPPQIQRKHNP